MRASLTVIAVSLLLLSGCNKSDTAADKKEKEDNSPGVHLSDEDVKGLGLKLENAASARYVPGVSGYGVVTSLDSIAQADSDLVAAQATASQSQASANRARELSTGEEAAVSREQLDAAEAKAAADQAALALARRKADAAFGLNPLWRDAGARARIMGALGAGRAVLVRATFPLGALKAGKPQSLSVTPLDGDARSFTTTQIWDAPSDPAIPGRSFYLLLDGSGLAQGARVTVTAPSGAAETGVRIPESALVLSESESWAYVQTKPGTFLRQPVDISKPLPGGYFEAEGKGISAGQPIVTDGAGLLLARETNPSTEPEE
jgi:hypothetical protein